MDQTANLLKSLQNELDEADQKVEGIEGQLAQLELAETELTRREHRLQLDLDTNSRPGTLYAQERPADIAIELARVRAGINELGQFKRDVQRSLGMAKQHAGELAQELKSQQEE